MLNSIRLSVTSIQLTENGVLYDFIGFGNFRYLFGNDPTFLVTTLQTALSVFGNLFLTLVFSMFIAMILVQKFRGRLFARAMFFLPVIVASGVVMGIINGDSYSQTLIQGDSARFQLTVLENALRSTGLGTDLIQTIVKMMNSIFQVVWRSGIQILIFMSALQAVPVSVKEAAAVEGATSWEFFWKITFTMVLPTVQLNLVYTVIDSFTDSSNGIIKRIFELNKALDYSYSSAVAWTYFALVFAMVIVVYILVNRAMKRYEH